MGFAEVRRGESSKIFQEQDCDANGVDALPGKSTGGRLPPPGRIETLTVFYFTPETRRFHSHGRRVKGKVGRGAMTTT